MAILHTVNRSPLEHDALSACAARVQEDGAILLYEDGVYGALATIAALKLSELSCKLYVLEPDFAARGLLKENMHNKMTCIDYDGFVKLCAEHNVVQAWS